MRTNLLLGGVMGAAGVFALTGNSYGADNKPNVVMIIVDDWGYHDMSCTGSKFYETPNVDRLVDNSVIFEQGYAAYPRSVPSRYSLFTGMNCARPQGDTKGEKDGRIVDENSFCIAEAFKAADYDTYFIGKWHLSTDTCMPEDKGFDINIGGGHAGAPRSYFAPFNESKTSGNEKRIVGMDDAGAGEYLTDYMTDKMVAYLSGNHAKPFFAVCSYYAVHTPLQAKKDIIAKYEAKRERLGLTDDSYIEEEAGVRKAQQNNPVYAAMIESVDEGVGRIIASLKNSGVYDNTVIVLISDHGGLSNRGARTQRELATTNAPLKAGKGHLYEGGVKIPYVIHLPGQTVAKVYSDPVVNYDLAPTLAGFCGAPIPDHAVIDGTDLSPYITGTGKKLPARDIYWHKASERPGPTGDYLSTAVRSGDWKLIDFYQQGRIELYNIAEDPGETVNLAPAKKSVVRKLMKKINKWRGEINVIMP